MRRPARPKRGGQVDDDEVLTARAIADEGSSRSSATGSPRLKQARAGRRRAPSSTTSTRRLTVEQGLVVFTHLYRLPRGDGTKTVERALEISLVDRRATKVDKLSGEHAAAALDRPGAGAPSADDAARRADRRPGPTGPPGAVGTDRRIAVRGRLDSYVDALHRGGRAPVRRRDDHVARPRGRYRPARRPDRRAREDRGGRGLRRAAQARRGRGDRARGRPEHPHRHLDRGPAPGLGQRRHPRGRAPAGEPRTSSCC